MEWIRIKTRKTRDILDWFREEMYKASAVPKRDIVIVDYMEKIP